MNYATNYDIGDRKRSSGINEDSVAISVFEQGHREGFRGQSHRVDERDGLDDRETTGDSDESGGTEPQIPANRSGAAFALADGAGGYDAGDVASYIATTEICKELAPLAIRAVGSDPTPFDVEFETRNDRPDTATIEGAIEDAIISAHRAILAYAASSGTGAYTTVVAGICAGGKLHYGWVGDSRAYVLNREREQIAQLTKDHAVVERLRDAGQIDDVEAHVHPRGNEITLALGGQGHEDPEKATIDVETDTVELFAEDIVFVTSDGIIDAQTDAPALYDQYIENDRSDAVAELIRDRVVTNDEIRDWILSADSLEEAVATLIARSNERGGKDNLSALLFTDPTLPQTPADGGLPVRAKEPAQSIADRETVILPDE